MQQLNSIGFIWDIREHAWNEQFDELCAFKGNNGHCNVPQHDARNKSSCDERNKSLGLWVNHQREFYKKNALNSGQIQRMNSIGFIWDPLKHAWNQYFDQLCEFTAQNGQCYVSHHDECNKSLGIWVITQRMSYKKNDLNSDRIQQLNSIGFVWDLQEHSHEQNVSIAKNISEQT